MTKKILVVDDSKTARTLFKICMKNYSDYAVLETDSWQEAINLAEAEKPYLTVLDYNMPEMHGPDIAKRIQEKGIDTYFVLMSANTQASVIDEVKALGFIDVLEKPITAEAVHSLLEKLT